MVTILKKNISNENSLAYDEVIIDTKLTVPRVTTIVRDSISHVDGEIIFNTTLNKFEVYFSSNWNDVATGSSGFVTLSGAETITNKTIDADNNSISNIDNSEIKSGANIDITKLDVSGGFNIADSTSYKINSNAVLTKNTLNLTNSTQSTLTMGGSTEQIIDFSNSSNIYAKTIDSLLSIRYNSIPYVNFNGVLKSMSVGQGILPIANIALDISGGSNEDMALGLPVQSASGEIDFKTTADISPSEYNGCTWFNSTTNEQRIYINSNIYDIHHGGTTDISNTHIDASAAIDATKIANGSITNTEFQFLNGITSTVVGINDTQILTNKTINADNNTITNIDNNDIKAGATINATKIANGSVSNADFQRLNGLTSDIVTLNASQTLTNKILDCPTIQCSGFFDINISSGGEARIFQTTADTPVRITLITNYSASQQFFYIVNENSNFQIRDITNTQIFNLNTLTKKLDTQGEFTISRNIAGPVNEIFSTYTNTNATGGVQLDFQPNNNDVNYNKSLRVDSTRGVQLFDSSSGYMLSADRINFGLGNDYKIDIRGLSSYISFNDTKALAYNGSFSLGIGDKTNSTSNSFQIARNSTPFASGTVECTNFNLVGSNYQLNGANVLNSTQLNLSTGGAFRINGVDILTATTLASSVTSAPSLSLTGGVAHGSPHEIHNDSGNPALVFDRNASTYTAKVELVTDDLRWYIGGTERMRLDASDQSLNFVTGGSITKLAIGSQQVLTSRQPAISNSVGGDESAKINEILAMMRVHGFIAT